MTANGGQKGRGGRNPRSSARLSLGPEDDWRSWSKLPTDAAEADEGDDEVATPELEGRLRGSMMLVVSGSDDATSAEADAAASVEPAPIAPPVAAAPAPASPPSSLPRRVKPDLPPPADITTELAVVADTSGIDGDAALAASFPDVEAGFSAPRPAAAPRPPRPAVANHPSAGRPRPAPNPPSPNPPAAAPAAEATPRPTPAPVELAIFSFESDPAATRSPVDDPGRGRPYGDPRRAKKAAGDDIAIVLLSDPELEDTPARRPAPPRARSKAAPRPAAPREPRSDPADGPTVSGLMAEAVSLLEARVTRQAEEIEVLLEELETRYDDELARLDGEVHRELSNRGQGVPKEFEDRVHTSFMQLVERLERLESGRAATPAPAAAPAPAPAVVVPAALDEVVAQHQALAEQNVALAEAQQLVAAGHQQISGQLETALAQVAELSQQVAQLVAAIPEADRRIAGLERHTASQLALFQARVDDLAERFPAVEGAVEVVTRHTDSIAELRNTMDQFRAALDHEVSGVHQRLDEVNAMRAEVAALQERSASFATEFTELSGRLDTTDERTNEIADAASTLTADFLRLQAETDRRSSAAEARVLDLEDAIGGEVGVERNLLLDRIEEMERGLYELNPDSFARRDGRSGSDSATDGPPGPGH